MTVSRIGDAHHAKVGAALEVMVKKHRAGRLTALLFIGEEIGSTEPLYGLVGRFRSDPVRAIGHLAVMKEKVTDFAADLSPDLPAD